MNKSQSLQLSTSKNRAKSIVKLGLEYTDQISEYYESEHQIVGKTGVSFPRVLWSYGESITINFHETENPDFTEISVYAEKEVVTNITANPQKTKRAFLDNLEWFRNLSEEELNEYIHYIRQNRQTKATGNRRERTATYQRRNQTQSPSNQVNQSASPQSQQQNPPTASHNQSGSVGQTQNHNRGRTTQQGLTQNQTKQVNREEELSNGSNIVLLFMVASMIIVFLLMLAAMP